MVNVTSRKQALNHKFDHFFSCLIQLSSKEFGPVSNLYSDEQNSISQGHNDDKQQVTFNRAGYGFLIDAVCENGYTIKLYPRNVPPQKKWIVKG